MNIWKKKTRNYFTSKESEEKLKFEQEQLIEMKKKEIERKERTINQMTEINKIKIRIGNITNRNSGKIR